MAFSYMNEKTVFVPAGKWVLYQMGPSSPQHVASSGCRWRRPPDMEGSCEYMD
jgi:hypothetical protein